MGDLAKLTSGLKARQVTRWVKFVVTMLGLNGCGSLQPSGAPGRAAGHGAASPRLFDASAVYRSLGALVGGGTLPFVASVRYLAGPTPDSTLALFSVSLTNQTLTFQRRGDAEFVAEYHVEASFWRDSTNLQPVRQISSDEQVLVRNFQDTLRNDESVIFQQFIAVPPGVYTVGALVRDRNGPAFARAERIDTVPRFDAPGLSKPVAVYTAEGRLGRGVPLAGSQDVAWATIVIVPSKLPVGAAELQTVAGRDTTRARFLVSFSNQWVITNFDEMMSLLRYFDRQDWVDSLRRSTPERRPDVWRDFWKATDPVPLTPENEALDDYFRRVQQANIRFPDEGGPGWLTERGEVFITLGEADEMIDLTNTMERSGMRVLRWTYTSQKLTLYFQDQTGFSHFRLTPSSRSDYQRVLMHVRQSRQ